MIPRLSCCVTVSMMLVSASFASDWPQFLGPDRNGVYPGTDLTEAWPQTGPPKLWTKAVGHGWSGPVVTDHKLVICHRQADQELVECLDASSGAAVWSFSYPTAYVDDFGFDNGPRATPCVSGGRIYTLGAQGMVHCLDFTTGKKLWSVDVQSRFQAGNGFFGMACSPLVEGELVLLNIGGPKGAGIAAFNKIDGKLVWKTSDDEASYSSPVSAAIGGHRYALFLTRDGLIGLEPKAGTIQFQYSWHSRNRMSVNAATPLVLGDTIFLSASYGTGATLLRLRGQDLEKIWASDDLLSNHYATSIEYRGFLYGVHGRTDPGFRPHPMLRCVDLKSPKVCWETDTIGAATLVRAGDQLLILTETGELLIAQASPASFKAKARAHILDSEVRAFPAVADGLFYARSKDQLVCLDLGKVQVK